MLSIQGLVRAILLICCSSLWAYQPERWSHINLYVETGVPGGPQSLLLLAPGGKVRKKAFYKYDPTGRLLRESYVDAEGVPEGETRFIYRDKRVMEETLHDANGQLRQRKLFAYNQRGLAAIRIYNNSNRLLFHQLYTVQKKKLAAGKQILGEDKTKFRIQYDRGRPDVLVIFDEGGRSLGRFVYKYDKEGRLVERERIQKQSKSRCTYKYNEAGKLKSYSYFDFMNGHWVLLKTLELHY